MSRQRSQEQVSSPSDEYLRKEAFEWLVFCLDRYFYTPELTDDQAEVLSQELALSLLPYIITSPDSEMSSHLSEEEALFWLTNSKQASNLRDAAPQKGETHYQSQQNVRRYSHKTLNLLKKHGYIAGHTVKTKAA